MAGTLTEVEDKHSYVLEALREDADIQAVVARAANPAFPDTVVKATTANVGPKIHGEKIWEGKMSKGNRGRAFPLGWGSDEVEEERRQKYSDTEEALAWVNLSQENIENESVQVGKWYGR